MKALSVRSLDASLFGLVAVAALLLSFSLMPRAASAAAVTLTSITATSTNSSTAWAKQGDSVRYQLTVSANPLITPQINIFGLGSTTMTSTGTGTFTYSTTTSSINAWSQGAVTFNISVGGTTGAEATTTVTQANLTGSNVTYDSIAPTNPTGISGLVFRSTATISLASTDTNTVTVYYTTDGSTPSCTHGTAYSSSFSFTNSTTVSAIACDAAGNTSAVVSALYSPVQGGNGAPAPAAAPSPTATAATPATPAAPAHTATTTPAAPATPATPATPAIPATPAAPAASSAKALSASQVQSILDVLASFNADASTIAMVKASLQGKTAGSVASAAVHAFKKYLAMGSVGSDVKALQQYLNSHGYSISASGAGSLGNETETFGPATRAALIKYQKAKNITPATGYFGPKTRAAIEAGE
ncbi:MAG: peptidoglycan-binding protein [Patescibacteria group bacterium]|nr:peptidoglycan-binding protein [Patescibacteria group bacterium]